MGDNIDLMTTILSRFDCIFIVRDVRDVERDKNIARHVLGVHMTASSDTAATGDIDVPTLKKLIAYCRERCAPRLSDEASALLSDQYVHIRNSVRESLKNNPTDTVVVPITIRQLEALVRLSESLAKMRLSAEATVSDVEEALRLFKVCCLTHLLMPKPHCVSSSLSFIALFTHEYYQYYSFILSTFLFISPHLSSPYLTTPLFISPHLPSSLLIFPHLSSPVFIYHYHHQVSTLAASQSSSSSLQGKGGGIGSGAVQNDDVRKAEEFLKRRMGLRVTVNSKQIIDEAQAQVCGVCVCVVCVWEGSVRVWCMRVCVCEWYCVVWCDVTLPCHILINTKTFDDMPHSYTAHHEVLFPSFLN